MNKEKIIICLKSNVKKFNRWRLLYGITEINLEYANLDNANLDNANLNYANLNYANLNYANLNYASLYKANLNYASLENANLNYANLNYANLYNANLNYASLYNANLDNASLENAMLERITGKLILSVNGIGSRTSTTIYNYTDDQIQCDCFFGSFQQWLKKIKKTYTRDNRHYQEYKRAACYLFWQARYMASMVVV